VRAHLIVGDLPQQHRTFGAARLSTWVAMASTAAAALYVVGVRAQRGFVPAHDLYAYFYPKALYALASVRDGGRGLLWNPYQNCGQPFFAISQTGVLYPPYFFFLLFEPELALRAVLFVHLLIAGSGAFFLCRELGARPVAAVAGALAFQLSHAMVGLTASSPTHGAPFAWMPLILFLCERLLRAPSLRRACLLAIVLAVSMLPGMPQTVFFIYQVIVLRVVYELATRRGEHPLRPALPIGLALLIAVPLAAVQLVPELENAGASLRGAKLAPAELDPYGAWTLADLRGQLEKRATTQPFMLVPTLLGLTGLLAAKTRRLTAFYAGTATLFTVLAIGSGSPLYDLYIRFPVAGAFRIPGRFLWITGFCLAPLTALGIEAIASASRAPARGRAMLAAALTALPLLALWWLTPKGFSPAEWTAALLIVAGSCAAFAVPGLSGWIPGVFLAALLLQVLVGPYLLHVHLLRSAPEFFAAEPAFARLRQSVGAQDRLYLLHDRGYEFMAKSASLFRMPSVLDYEPLTTQRYAEYSVMLRTGEPMRNANSFIYSGPKLGAGWRRPLLDLTAARFVIVSESERAQVEQVVPPLQWIDTVDGLSLYENPRRLPRAFFVPRVEVVSDPAAVLRRLAQGADDLRRVALVEAPPSSGFLGADAATVGASVRFARNDPEDLILEVDAPVRGFLVLSDQYFSGWSATVDGRPAPIERANYAFRLVEVPAGRSTVTFRYAPRSLWVGAGVSAASAMAVAALLLYTRRRPPADAAR
jgi:hypothetical protein